MLVGKRVSGGISMDVPQCDEICTLPVLLCVADGIGGSIAGDIASQKVMRCFAQDPVPVNETEIKERLLSAESYLNRLVSENPLLNGLGTTIAGALCDRQTIVIFSCGDSRVYLSRKGQDLPVLVTRDHSVIQEMIDSGKLNEEEARSHPLGHVITSCISGGIAAIHPDMRAYHIEPDDWDRLIICTDGVWDYGGVDFLKAAVGSISPFETVLKIHTVCMSAGAPDNFTIVISDIKR